MMGKNQIRDIIEDIEILKIKMKIKIMEIIQIIIKCIQNIEKRNDLFNSNIICFCLINYNFILFNLNLFIFFQCLLTHYIIYLMLILK